jgi:hypothetical protein
MAQVNPGSLTDWQNGQTITAEAYKQEREIIYTAINAFVSTTNGSSGADQVGATQLIAGSGTTVQAILEYLYTELLNATVGQIPDGSLTDVKLSNAASDLKQTALLKAGGTMTGLLTLSGAPSSANHATTKTYVDTAVAGVDLSSRVAKAGDTMTGALTMPAGTAADPTIKDVNDTDTGIFFPSAGKFGISTNGSSRLEVDTAGIVTIGGSNVGAKLLNICHLTGTTTATYQRTTHFRWRSSYGTNCTVTLEVNGYHGSGGGATAYFQLWNFTDSAQVVELTTTSASDTNFIESSSLSLIDGKTYGVRVKASSGQVVVLAAYLKIV